MLPKLQKRKVLIGFAGLLLGMLAYIPGIVAWFTAEELALIYTVRDNPLGMWSGLDGLPGFFRPVIAVLIWAQYRFWELEPRPYHIFNVALHLWNSCMVFIIAREWSKILPETHKLREGIFPAVAALWFWVWPSHSEPVVWIPGITDLAAAFFGLSAIAAYLMGRNQRNLTLRLTALLLFAFALASKESAITLPGVIFLYEFSRWWTKKEKVTTYVSGPMLFSLVVAAYFGLRYLLLGVYFGGYGTAVHTDYSWARIKWTLAPNLTNSFMPLPLSNIYQKTEMLIILSLLSAAAIAWRYRQTRQSPILLVAVFFGALVAFLPGLNLGPNFITEGQRFAYVASAFGVLTVAGIVCYVIPSQNSVKMLTWVAAIACAGLLASYNANWYYAGKITRGIVRGIKKLPPARRLYVLYSIDSYREAFIMPHSLGTIAKLLPEPSPVQEFEIISAVNYWNPDLNIEVHPKSAAGTTYTISLLNAPEPAETTPRIEPYGSSYFHKAKFDANLVGNTVHVLLKDYDPAHDKVGYTDGSKWVILPQ